MRRALLALLPGLLLAQATVPAFAQTGAPAQAQETAWPARARTAVDYLDAQWGKPADWNGIEAWQRFVVVDALLDYQRRTGDRRLHEKVGAAVRNRTGLYLNDDALWAVIANIHAWQDDRDPALLDYAATTYKQLVGTYWDDRCGGGLWWNPARTYKNAITNELLLYASSQLFLATGEQGYRDWALRTWNWFEHSSMIGPDGLVNDGLDANCRNNGQPYFTYNQGVLLGGLTDLTTITGDARYRAVAVKTAIAAARGLSTPEGILREPVPIGSDGLIFKGVFAFHLGHLLDDMAPGPERSELTDWVRRNADAVWRSSASGTRAIGSDWSLDGTLPASAAAQTSGIAMMLAGTGMPLPHRDAQVAGKEIPAAKDPAENFSQSLFSPRR
ncbi:glycoside hydrolase family 76 protein [Novosphingobium sp. BL-8H]|uniref:glycoside hydrolase family 76 protein n=1 Tax=Novosphingobium sp. BL-8H TaxID=3127640 RepID=UPI003757D9D7